jgi:outer membrane protein OmpA-like peptidoglycan-associated protein
MKKRWRADCRALGGCVKQRTPTLRSLSIAAALVVVACAAPTRPPAMARVAEVRASPATAEAETWAPQAHAHALELEERAEQALKGGDPEAAGLLAEQAIAAHEHAWVLTRLARAERRRLDAEAELDAQHRALGDLRAQHQRLSAEAAALELRSQVVRSALSMPPREASAAERQQARARAASALSAQARLLCVSARLLGEGERVQALIPRLDELDRRLTSDAAPKQLELATELRSECLRAISEVRRQNSAPAARPVTTPEAASAVAPDSAATGAASLPGAGAGLASNDDSPATPQVAANGHASGAIGMPASAASPLPADVLLDELSAAGVAPSRDDRGVTVSLRDLFAPDGALNERAREELKRLGQIAGRHPDFPVLLVGHSASPRGAPEVDRQLATVSSALSGSGVAKLEAWSVGDREPLLPAHSPAANARNQRIELVFVAPGF